MGTKSIKLPPITLIEVVIVVATIIFLATIRVPSHHALPVRSMVSRVRADQRTLAASLEAYAAEHGALPPTAFLRDWAKDAGALERAGGLNLPAAPQSLTTPVAYQLRLWDDPFAPQGGMPFVYHADREGWILISPGPDREYDIADPAAVYDSAIPQPSAHLLAGGPWTYDPTNGTVSRGDVWRVRER